MTRRGNNEGTIYERSDGRWCAAVSLGWQGGRRRRRYLYGATKDEVRRKMVKAIQAHTQGETPAPERETVATFLERWLAFAKTRVRPSTYETYAAVVNGHLSPGLGGIRLTRLSVRHVQEFLDGYAGSDLSPRRVAMIRAVLRTALNQAIRWGELTRNAAALAEPPRQKRSAITPLTVGEAAGLVQAVGGHRLEALYLTTLTLGLRRGEVLGLTWDDVDLEDKRLTVARALQRVTGEGLQVVEPKSETSRRTVVMPDFLVAALKAHAERQADELLRAGKRWKETGHVFTREDGRPLDPNSLSRGFRKLLQDAGLRPVRFHDLRHSCASFLFAEGLTLREIKETLGHSSIRLTADTYTHLLPEAEQRPADAMERLFGGGSGQ